MMPVLWSRPFREEELKRFGVLVLGALAFATPTSALEVLESVFQVSYTHDGQSYTFNDTYVPLLPGNACYNWYVRVDATSAPLTVGERMTLPIAIDWGTQLPETVIEEDGKVAVTTSSMTTDGDGWFTHGWCAAEGDPTGPHLIEVSVDGQMLASFPFEVLGADIYNFPAPVVPERALRSANNTW
jgi:hypothetical protein